MQAGVAIASLLISSKNKSVYRICCIVADNVTEENLKQLRGLVHRLSEGSEIIFKRAGNAFADGHVRGYISTATYYRLMLHKMFPDIDKIIYSDADVIFLHDLADYYAFDLKDNYIGAVIDNLNVKSVFDYHYQTYESWRKYKFENLLGSYVNIGVSLWNLQKIRQSKIYEKWQALITEPFPYSDQDIINYTCRGKISLVPPVYNAMAANYGKLYAEDRIIWQAMKDEKIITAEEYDAVYNNPQIVHYIGPKPWNEPVARHYEDWWKAAEQTPFIEAFAGKKESAEK